MRDERRVNDWIVLGFVVCASLQFHSSFRVTFERSSTLTTVITPADNDLHTQVRSIKGFSVQNNFQVLSKSKFYSQILQNKNEKRKMS